MIYLVFTLIFIVLQGFYSGIETGLISIRRPRLHHHVASGNKAAKLLDFFTRYSPLMLSTTLIGTNICVVCASIGAKKTIESFGFHGNVGMLATAAFLTILLLTAEVLSKTWFRQAPYDHCVRFSYLLYTSYILLYLPVKIFSGLSSFLAGFFSSGDNKTKARLRHREDFRVLLKESQGSGMIESGAADILDNAIDFYGLTVKDIQIPLSNVKSLAPSATIREAMRICRSHGYSRVPVLSGSQGCLWMGVFSVYDAIFMIPEEEWDSAMVIHCLRPLNAIPSTASLKEVLDTAKKLKSPLLAVTDLHDKKKFTGIVTPGDVVGNLFE